MQLPLFVRFYLFFSPNFLIILIYKYNSLFHIAPRIRRLGTIKGNFLRKVNEF